MTDADSDLTSRMKSLELPPGIVNDTAELYFSQFKYKQQDDGYIEEDVTDHPLLEGVIPQWKWNNPLFSLRNLNESDRGCFLSKLEQHKQQLQMYYSQPRFLVSSQELPKTLKAKYDQDREQAKRELKVLKSSHESEMKRLI